jgi:hypothetical protein
MRHRDLAAIAVTATVAATPALATVIEDLATAPPAAASEGPVVVGSNGSISCVLWSPSLQANTVRTELFEKGTPLTFPACKPGTLSLQSSVDHSHWKTLAQTHQTSWSYETVVSHQCLTGTSWYQSYFVADDGSFKGGTDNAFPTQFTC